MPSLYACRCVAIGWIYGTDRFAADTMSMTRTNLPKPLLAMYKYVIPGLLTILVLFTFVALFTAAYAFPPSGIVVGVLLSCCTFSPIAYFLGREALRAAMARQAARRRLAMRAPPCTTAHPCKYPSADAPGATSAATTSGLEVTQA